MREINIEAITADEQAKSTAFTLIGEFIYWFSQLEFTIRGRLADTLDLPDNLFDIITSSYDFSALCNVTKNILLLKHPDFSKEIESLFSKLRAINDDRVRVAHGLWADGPNGYAARHVSRNSLKPSFHFESPDQLRTLIDRARALMIEVISPFDRATSSIRRLSVEISYRDDTDEPSG